MREESHLDDMRAAIRGDFERLAQRRGAQELMREPEAREPEPAPLSEQEPEPSPLVAEPEAEPAPMAEAEPAEAFPPDETHAGELPRRNFLDRLLGR